jgi:2-polyprenyl-3-methyl-5-hydroxy-6-metoxy-1,4-benzoquinol methylase
MECRICSNKINNQQYEAREMMYGFRDTHRYFQCSLCGCLQINEFPSDIQKYYDATYYSYQPMPQEQKSKIKHFFINLRDEYALFKRGLIGKMLYSKYPTTQFQFLQPSGSKPTIDSRILDVGCGAGQLLQLLRALGFNQLFGIDPYIDNDIDYKNGVTIKKQTIQEVRGDYDVIMFHHSFEHVPDPIAVLNSAFTILTADGYCVIRIPIASSHAWKQYGVHWVQLDAPRHFFLHSVESMEIVAEKVGFKLSQIIYDSTAFQFWGSEQYENNIPLKDERSYAINPQNSIFSEKDILVFAKRADELNANREGDQAIFYLRK